MMLAELCTQYLTGTAPDHAPSTRYALQTFFARVVEDLGDVPLEALTPDRLSAWQQRLSQQRKPSTVHKDMVRLGGALRYAVQAGWLDTDPLARVRTPAPGQGRVRFLTPEECVRLLAACRQSRNPHLYPIVTVALHTGGWKEEIRCLRWSQVNLAAGVVRFAKTKKALGRAVPLLGEALVVVQRLKRAQAPRCPWVFPRPDGRHPTPLGSAWLTARAHAGLGDVHFHDLRHTFAASCAMSGASLQDIATLLGHRHIQHSLIYAALMPSDPRAAVERMMRTFLDTPPARDESATAPKGVGQRTAEELLSGIDEILRRGR